MEDYIIKETKNTKITVRDVQEKLLVLMKEIDRICLKHNIDYILDGGSALGAIRHKGFIPWDDDLDIAFMRKDYNRLIEALKEDLDDKYSFQCFQTHKEYNVLIPDMKIRIKDTYIKEVNTLLKHNCKGEDGLFIDVFIIDYFNEKESKNIISRLCNVFLMPIIALLENIGIRPTILKKLFVNNAIRLNNRNINSKYIGHAITWTFKSPFKPYFYTYDKVFPPTRVQFEDTLLPVANDYDHYLTKHFTNTYMTFPPVNARAPKHIVEINLKGKTNDLSDS